ncbi:ABC transporter permease [Litoribacter alkaliphilus]|uniref:ABC transporter permease n=1 Tax=Litoribacter ruber TaxID=702568 RepID=A0AAP2CFK7_9BACT|nr:FtsX-like permease family protein [Litoribacter alkaliphilus]MBS9522805.1 ABC transporter permease [Litoribacter alkaliphilus]
MWKNYFTISIRNLGKRKLYAGINILGLTIAIVSFLAISLYIHHEWNYDKMYTGYDRIYKLNQEFFSGGEGQMVSTSPSALVPAVLEDIPEVETGTVVFDLSIFSTVLITGDELSVEESKFAYADQNFFKVFDFQLLEGNPEAALAEPNQLVLTESTARRYFGDSREAVGHTLRVESGEYTVSAVMEDFPTNSHLDFDFLASFKSHRHGREPEWSPSNYYSYIKLSEGAKTAVLKTKMEQLVEKYLGETQRDYNFQTAMHLQPVTGIHLRGEGLSGVKPGSDMKYLYIFGIVAVLLIFIGIINYVNLATAEATERNKEVGLRKVMGADRRQLFNQFISESFILTAFGLVCSMVLLAILGYKFEEISGVPMQIGFLFTPIGIGFLLLLLLLVACLAGIYPAVILSGMDPLKALGKKNKLGGGAWLRKSLVVIQFFISIGLLIATMIVKQQLDYMQAVNLGYDKQQLISINTHHKMMETIPALKSELVRKGVASSASLAADMPIYIKGGYAIEAGFDNTKEISITGYAVDEDIIKTIGAGIVAGNDFTEQDISRSQAFETGEELPIILNESAVRELGWSPEEAVGKKVLAGNPARIKAVVSDFYFNSLHHKVGPLMIFIDKDQTNLLLVRLAKGNPAEHLASLEETCKGLVPDRPFNYKFVDQEYANLYQSEVRVGRIFSLFAGIAVVIACMGLFGLVSYVALRRTREISIRKVLGASGQDVLKLLSSDFFMLLAISSVLAVIFGLWFSSQWLSGFANRAVIPLWIYPSAILVVALISFLTIGYRTVTVFVKRPAETLKDE